MPRLTPPTIDGLAVAVTVLVILASAPIAPAGATPVHVHTHGSGTPQATAARAAVAPGGLLDTANGSNDPRSALSKSPLDLRNASGSNARLVGTATDGTVRRVLVLSSYSPERQDRLAALGATVETRYGARVQARLPADSLSRIRGLSWVERVRPVSTVASSDQGSVVSEGLPTMNVSGVHALNITGDGVKVGVLDTGFDTSNPEIADNVAASRDFSTADGATGHGTAVSELIVDTAPDVELYLGSINTDIEFANAVAWLREQDVDVIVMSAVFFGEPNDGTGFVSEVTHNATTDGIVWVNSAGNEAERHWEGSYADTDADDLADFGNDGALVLAGGQTIQGRVSVFLSWNEFPATDQDYDLGIVRFEGSGEINANLTRDTIVATSTDIQDGNDPPVERIRGDFLSGGVYYLVVENAGASGTQDLELFLPSGPNVTPQVANGSIVAPAVAPNVTAIGAYNHADLQLEPFSSRGPTNSGARGLDFLGPDRVSTSTDAFSPFAGTSASAPHVGGVAALVVAANPGLSRAQVTDAMATTAIDAGPAGVDPITGHGRLDAFAAVERARTGVVTGQVADLAGAGVANATVTVTDGSTTVARTATNATGGYAVQVAPGTYTLTVAKGNFTTAQVSDVAVTPGATITRNVVLSSTGPATEAARTLATSGVAPGGTATVTVDVTARNTNDVTITERFAPAFAATSVDQVAIDGSGQALLTTSNTTSVVATVTGLSTGTVVSATYTVTVPANATAGTVFTLNGTVTTDNGTVPLGADQLTVRNQSSVVERFDANGDGRIDLGELVSAAEDFAAEAISLGELVRVAEAFAAG